MGNGNTGVASGAAIFGVGCAIPAVGTVAMVSVPALAVGMNGAKGVLMRLPLLPDVC